MPPDETIIALRDLTKTYDGVRAVDGVTLSIKKGEIFGLLGPNGAGKTTTIKIMTTLSRPDGGVCTVGGFDVTKEPRGVRGIIGVVPQENNLEPELTAYENLLIYGLLHKVTPLGETVRGHLEMVDLWERRDQVVSQFSGGMKRRLVLARALLADPAILFLDEPSTGLDPQIRRHLWDIVRKTQKEGRTVILTTHYIEEAEALCDRVGIISHGRLIALDTPGCLKDTVGGYVVEYIDAEGRLVQHLCRDRAEAHEIAGGIRENVTIRKTNLEDVFIKLTGERIE
ncbi:MAG TPA: ATP-binding cassette domain-containing protein [Syntrophales bacterium]|nr:ATP-binding cassette domain-containing protein [Syntrophales bacterium]HOM06620.1 ATP-binding cassette domain-containing protein [Syntrophales bacterium]HPQ06281.1 ATP-binding cassette domain-containing protein [Syntrophales bacterium]